jgi:hypothetical protein
MPSPGSYADRLCVEHVVANERSGVFYERESFVVETDLGKPHWQPCPRRGARSALAMIAKIVTPECT